MGTCYTFNGNHDSAVISDKTGNSIDIFILPYSKNPHQLTIIPVSRRISRRPPAEKNFGLAAVDFAKPPVAGQKKFG